MQKYKFVVEIEFVFGFVKMIKRKLVWL